MRRSTRRAAWIAAERHGRASVRFARRLTPLSRFAGPRHPSRDGVSPFACVRGAGSAPPSEGLRRPHARSRRADLFRLEVGRCERCDRISTQTGRSGRIVWSARRGPRLPRSTRKRSRSTRRTALPCLIFASASHRTTARHVRGASADRRVVKRLPPGLGLEEVGGVAAPNVPPSCPRGSASSPRPTDRGRCRPSTCPAGAACGDPAHLLAVRGKGPP
jgi:hypothetical protein